MCVFKRMCCKLTALFAAARFFIWPATTNPFNKSQSVKRNQMDLAYYLVVFDVN